MHIELCTTQHNTKLRKCTCMSLLKPCKDSENYKMQREGQKHRLAQETTPTYNHPPWIQTVRLLRILKPIDRQPPNTTSCKTTTFGSNGIESASGLTFGNAIPLPRAYPRLQASKQTQTHRNSHSACKQPIITSCKPTCICFDLIGHECAQRGVTASKCMPE